MTEYISRSYGGKNFEIIIKTDNADHYKAADAFAHLLVERARADQNSIELTQPHIPTDSGVLDIEQIEVE